jgi:arsenate reductase
MKLKVLFLCTGNSCRSQMAEGWAKHLKADGIEAYSAGTNPKRLDPRAVKAMAEVGIDISLYRPKHVNELMHLSFDAVITVCDSAAEACPLFPGRTKVFHRSFDDPPRLVQDAKAEEEAMLHYRRVREEIREFVAGLPEGLGL